MVAKRRGRDPSSVLREIKSQALVPAGAALKRTEFELSQDVVHMANVCGKLAKGQDLVIRPENRE